MTPHFFNYELHEETWVRYARRQREIRLSLRKIMDSDTHILSMEEFNKLKAAGPGGKVDEETDTRQSIPEVAARTVAVMEERYVPCSRY